MSERVLKPLLIVPTHPKIDAQPHRPTGTFSSIGAMLRTLVAAAAVAGAGLLLAQAPGTYVLCDA